MKGERERRDESLEREREWNGETKGGERKQCEKGKETEAERQRKGLPTQNPPGRN